MKKKQNKKKLSITLLVVIIVMLIVVGVIGASFYKDRQNFNNASKDIHSIFEALGYPISDKDTNQYCMYNNMKYSKGSLICTTESTLSVEGFLFDGSKLDKTTSSVGWKFHGSNLGTWKKMNDQYIFANLYDKGELRCSIRIKTIDYNQSMVELDCSGPARAEWFPVKKD